MIKVLVTIVTAGILAGCAATYTLDGQKYKNSTEFQSAVDAQRSMALTSIKPLPKPLTPKKLIAAIPSEQSLYAENIRRVTTSNGSPPNGVSLEIIENLTKSNYKLRILCITSFSAFPTQLNQQVTSANLSEIGVMQRFPNKNILRRHGTKKHLHVG